MPGFLKALIIPWLLTKTPGIPLLHALILFFVELCLLRRAPQDLPASRVLLGLAITANLVMSALLGIVVDLPLFRVLAEAGVDLLFTLGLLYLALRFFNRLPRFQQTATALIGAGALLGFVSILPLSYLSGGQPGQQSPLAGLMVLALIGWSILVTGHVLRHGFDLRLGQGVVVSAAYSVLSYNLIGGMFTAT
jgi:hypothetical protein